MDMSSARANPTAEPERRRRRPPVSCSLCRRRKIKCNRQSPCNNCIRSNNKQCFYEKLSPPPAQRSSPGRVGDVEHHRAVGLDASSTISRGTTDPSFSSTSIVSNPTCPSTPGSLPSTGEVELLRLRIKQLEEQLSKATQRVVASEDSSPSVDIRTTNSHFVGELHHRREHLGPSQAANITSTIMHKGRLFGQSHWVHGATEYLKIVEIVEPLLQDETSKVCLDVQKCKYLGKIIKARRTPPWPTSPTADLPTKEVADTLVEIYLRTFESVRRVVHVPTFRQDYEALWAADSPPDMAFVVQLKLVLSLGAAMYDDYFSLLPSAIRWIYEAQTWLSEPAFKSRLTIQFLQNNILLLLAREIVGVSGSLVWISAGSLLRTAMFMGLHRDPSCLPGRNTFTREMHRRIWNTILEITLQTSLESGGPPLVSLDDFDTRPPGNFNDDQIMAENAVPRPSEEFTQVSIALALRRLFPHRLAILKFLNTIGAHNNYNETLRLDSELRTSYKSVCQALQACRSHGGSQPSQFQLNILEYLIQQFFLALHVPRFTAAMHETAYAFSRKVVIDSCIKAWCAIHPTSSIMGFSLQGDMAPAELQDITRLVTCSTGTVRYGSMMISALLSAELKTQLQEEDRLGPVLLRRDLLSILDDAKDWSWRCIETSETNIKGYMLLCMASAHLDALVRGIPKEQISGALVKAAEDAAARCLVVFQQKTGGNESEGGINFDAMSAPSVDNLPDLLSDWGFLIPDSQLNFDVSESMNWVYNGIA